MGFFGPSKKEIEQQRRYDAIKRGENPDAPPAQPAAPAAVSPTTPAPAGTMKTGVEAIVKPRVPDELKNYKKGGVIKCATGGVISAGEKARLKQKAMIKQKRGC